MLDPADGGRNLLLVFSDGLDTASWLTPERVLDSARRSDVVVYGVSSRGPEGSKFLDDLTELTGGATLKIESTRDLSAAFLKILDEFRQRYLISYSPAGVLAGGWHRLEVRVKGRRATVKARAGYQAGK
jgi:VWFA-related protein